MDHEHLQASVPKGALEPVPSRFRGTIVNLWKKALLWQEEEQKQIDTAKSMK